MMVSEEDETDSDEGATGASVGVGGGVMKTDSVVVALSPTVVENDRLLSIRGRLR
jgi:hypothetical protein